MENYKRLFKEAERIKPGESMWKNIAAAGSRARSSGPEHGRGHEAPLREARPWRLAASLAVGLGVVAALAVLFREPPLWLPGPPGTARRLRRPPGGDGGRRGSLLAEGLQEWHADLGVPAGERFEEESAESWTDDTMLLNPLLEE